MVSAVFQDGKHSKLNDYKQYKFGLDHVPVSAWWLIEIWNGKGRCSFPPEFDYWLCGSPRHYSSPDCVLARVTTTPLRSAGNDCRHTGTTIPTFTFVLWSDNNLWIWITWRVAEFSAEGNNVGNMCRVHYCEQRTNEKNFHDGSCV